MGSGRAALYLADAALVARLREAREPIALNGGADAGLPAGLAGRALARLAEALGQAAARLARHG